MKFFLMACKLQLISVSALAAEWIEIHLTEVHLNELKNVSALAAEWIEMPSLASWCRMVMVSALAAEWIEIQG